VGIPAQYLMLRGIFTTPGATPEQVAFYSGLLDKLRATPEWKDFMVRGAFKQTAALIGAYADAEESQRIDLAAAWAGVCAHHERRAKASGDPAVLAAVRRVGQVKETLMLRPLQALLAEPHMLSAWLSFNGARYTIEGGAVRWKVNPLEVLRDTYWLLDMDYRARAPAAYVIWDHDHALLTRALGFYNALGTHLGDADWSRRASQLAEADAPQGTDAAL
jgi:hypothetical protein